MENQKFVVKSCCCGCTLRTASIIIAVFSLVYGLASAGYSISLGVTGLNEAWLDLVINIYNVIFTIILMHGIRKDHHRLIMAWVWATGLSIALNITLGIVFLLITLSIVAAFVLFLTSALQVYFLVVVRSYGLSLTPRNTVVINVSGV
ncbi:uncharacterized protein LOC121869212 [Homarus americanus]|uniref:uncharacterized protein LOC121869212 n=1 Tax=Homarus americanus TaxID=6706 RepID=UPI001C4693D3|nr:uncharacterized protein LOC121869212 [Homarus americanus]XP_042226386.1 uncharacterized protein LOC121869212 [Homarus americanus]